MDTAGLRGFGVWARVALIGEVAGRVAAVLAPGSVQRVEQPVAVGALERAVAGAGGGEAGRAAVVDAVAYTWFNRIIALRFMDANGYTGVGVVSPQAGVTVGQPEILADAKRGVLDPQVVSSRTQQTVMALLDGTRPSPDPQGEAYGLLLAEYCRFWNQAMPFMFEPEGDFTELLMPANLLADDSVLNRAVNVLTAEVCADVEVIGWLYQFYISERKDEVFAGFKKNKKAGAAEIPAATQLFTPHWIVRYLVENSLGRLWMLNHPDSRLVEQMDYYIPPVDAETDFLTISSPEDIKIIDPACGSGHMLTYAFDLLYAIYQEEGYAPSQIPELILTHNLYGTEIDPRAGTLAAFALTMKATAKRKLFLKNPVQPNICVIEPISFTDDELDYLLTTHGDRADEETFWNQFRHADLLGSLIQPDPQLTTQLTQHLETLDTGDDLLNANTLQRAQHVITQAQYLQPRYTVSVANPPYMGRKNATVMLVRYLTEAFPEFKSDLFSAFVRRCSDLCRQGGYVGIMSPNVWMYISAHHHLRRLLIDESDLQSLIELPLGGFDGATVQICAYVFGRAQRGDRAAIFIRLVGDRRSATLPITLRQAVANPQDRNRFEVLRSSFKGLPGEPIVYWIAAKIAPAFALGTDLSTVAYTRIGLITGDNDSYLRAWYEVSRKAIGLGLSRSQARASKLRWFPAAKGGEFRKWYGNILFVVDWKDDGHHLQTRLDPTGTRVLAHNFNLDDVFEEGVTWSKLSSGRFSGRHLPPGFLFNDPAAAIFPREGQVPVIALLAYLSSGVADQLLRALNPTLNFQPGNVASLPWSSAIPIDLVTSIAAEALQLAKADWNEQETSMEFQASPLIFADTSLADLRKITAEVSRRNEERVARLLALEELNNATFAKALGLEGAFDFTVGSRDITLISNAEWEFSALKDELDRKTAAKHQMIQDLVSFAVGCMFGRYSLDAPGLVLADQGATVQDYLTKVPAPRFMPDSDNVLPIVDGDWFEDDIVARFRQFLRMAFGEQHFEENLRFVTESLGVNDIRDYFVKSFYKDHVQRYKKRPIYWMFSSPKGSFNALIYMHRYTPTTASTVLNEYLREFQAKVTASLDNAQRSNNAKEADRLRKILVELEEYEHDVLYPLATQRIHIDLDDGVKTNYPKLGKALKKIPGLETTQ